MALPGEVLSTDVATCEDCGTVLPLKVLRSAAGYYIGFFCPQCGPYSRESGYYRTYDQALNALRSGQFNR